VHAKDLGTGKEQSIKITATTNLTDEEVEKMRKDAEAHAEEDKKKRELIEIKNTADTMVYTTEKMMKEVEEKKIEVTEEERKAVEEKLAKLKEVKDGENIEDIKTVSEDLSKAAQVIGMKMYQQEQESAKDAKKPEGGSASEEKKEEPVEGEVVDAETEEVKEDKKE
ncbi:MAG: molecular chaperone DnaK, partial [Candidatus Magasanikbacteria bacterium]|nr:molecular chaperone DnaK [Candidatus Magasanikbacteria bacterium]